MSLTYYTIGQIAAEVGVSVHTLRYYEKQGLLPPIGKNRSGHRQYTENDHERVCFIKRAQRMNFSLAEIRELIAIASATAPNKIQARELVSDKLADVESNLAELKTLKRELTSMLSNCQQSTDDEDCPIINELASDRASQRKGTRA